MFKKSLLFSLSLVSFVTTFTSEFKINGSSLKCYGKIKNISLSKEKDGFYTEVDGQKEKAIVHRKSQLFKISENQLKFLLRTSKSYITVEDMGNGQYQIELRNKLKGGGLFGASAGAWFGVFITNTVCYGTIGVIGGAVGMVCPPVGVAVVSGLSGMFAPAISGLSMAIGIGCGVTGGVITGPI